LIELHHLQQYQSMSSSRVSRGTLALLGLAAAVVAAAAAAKVERRMSIGILARSQNHPCESQAQLALNQQSVRSSFQ